MKNAGKYSDIINLPHHQSAMRPRMANYDRAAQFSPFAALKGYEDEIEEAIRTKEDNRELSEEQVMDLNEKLIKLKAIEREHPLIIIVYFENDKKKLGGVYRKIIGNLNFIDEIDRKIILNDMKIKFDDVYLIEPQ